MTKSSSDLSRSRFRFNLSELLAVMALVSLSLVWPLILVFVVPLIGTKACKRMGYGSYAPVIATIGLSMALGVLFSFSYWHYPFEQPSTLAELCNIKAVEQLSWVSGLDSAGLSDPPAAIVNLPPAGTLYWNNARELDAVDRIIAEFANRHVAIRSSTPIPIEVLTSIWTAADQAGLLISGEGGYPDTKSLHGYIGIAHKHNGSRFAFAALMGGQQSNDHYPYYEFVVPMDQEKLAVESSHWFYVDIADIEGTNWLDFSIIAFILMLPITILLQLSWVIWQRKTERRSQGATNSCCGQTACSAGTPLAGAP